MENTISKPTVNHWIILWALGLLWGCSFILIKRGLVCFSPIQTASLRIGISALAFLPMFLWHIKKVDWSKLKYYVIVGMAGSGIPAILFANAQTQISSSISGILNSLTPLFTFVFGIAFFNTEGTLRKFLGVLLGLAGASILIMFGKEMGQSGHILYGMMVVLATMCYATSVNTVKKHLQDIHPIALSAVSFQIIGIPAWIILWKTDFIGTVQYDHEALISLGYLFVLAIVGTTLATILFFGLVQKTDALFGSMTTYIIPIMAVILGFLDGEVFSMLHVLGMACILVGVYLSRK